MNPTPPTRPEEMLRPGHSACPGCGVAMGMRLVLRTMGPKTAVVIVPSCSAVIAGVYPYTSLAVPAFHSAFEIAAPTAAGIANAFQAKGIDDVTVLAFAGDGGTFDIGLQSLSGAADRNEDFIYVCLDNEAYMNTGIQVSSSTPRFAWTGTSPAGNTRRKKQIMEIMAAHRIPYAATVSVGFPEDLARKVERAKAVRGTRFLHLLAPCPTGWKTSEESAARLAALAVETRIFPLYEIRDGLHYTVTHPSRGLPVEHYLGRQGRYRHLEGEHVAAIQAEADRNWRALEERAAQAASAA